MDTFNEEKLELDKEAFNTLESWWNWKLRCQLQNKNVQISNRMDSLGLERQFKVREVFHLCEDARL